MRAYIINLDRAPERWAHMKQSFETTKIEPCRVSAVDGKELSLPCNDFDERRFHLFHGRATNIYEVACYLSHIKAMNTFLETQEEYGLICEDDVFLKPDFELLLEEAIKASSSWNILRLTGLHPGKPLVVKKLTDAYELTVQMGRLKGAGAYLIDRKAAQVLVKKLLPMWLPWDHAIDREWFFGLRALSVKPFPISQTEEQFQSAIQGNSKPKLSSWRRYLTTYPYQAMNELSRWCFRATNIYKRN
ncbi:MAG: hypothetical protein A3F67_02805 [Verrucomicrobia bacterium RIFCSPHIGHO2_12_FULL_41_10]|nr:MAG: hypothetical protein A3F67_02805 [Verrucomicrobia bacterium RIFCSPHIGHO2_12_FULL_41_10]HLB34656.1 glycosyltransferase family 25 protein [Chthoniobacterales bacterium]